MEPNVFGHLARCCWRQAYERSLERKGQITKWCLCDTIIAFAFPFHGLLFCPLWMVRYRPISVHSNDDVNGTDSIHCLTIIRSIVVFRWRHRIKSIVVSIYIDQSIIGGAVARWSALTICAYNDRIACVMNANCREITVEWIVSHSTINSCQSQTLDKIRWAK